MTVQSTYTAAPAVAIAGMLADGHPSQHQIDGMRNDEASAEMAFGYAVKFNSTSDPRSAKLLTAITGEIVAGIVLFHQNYDPEVQLGTVGVKAGYEVNVVRKGRLWVICEDGCDIGDRLHVRAIATGGEIAGALRASADASDTIDSGTQAQWATQAAAGELAILDFDFTREPA